VEARFFFQKVPDRYGAPPGSDGVTAGHGGGPVGNPVVSSSFDSWQVPENVPQHEVYAGDTAGTSSGLAVPAQGVLFGAPGSAESGAGHGHAGHYRHPNGEGARDE
jgi:hypothetical protein